MLVSLSPQALVVGEGSWAGLIFREAFLFLTQGSSVQEKPLPTQRFLVMSPEGTS